MRKAGICPRIAVEFSWVVNTQWQSSFAGIRFFKVILCCKVESYAYMTRYLPLSGHYSCTFLRNLIQSHCDKKWNLVLIAWCGRHCIRSLVCCLSLIPTPNEMFWGRICDSFLKVIALQHVLWTFHLKSLWKIDFPQNMIFIGSSWTNKVSSETEFRFGFSMVDTRWPYRFWRKYLLCCQYPKNNKVDVIYELGPPPPPPE